jgi:hypothetical protein
LFDKRARHLALFTRYGNLKHVREKAGYRIRVKPMK